jgi:transcriptional regulator with XRE-family HTH domain
VDSDQQPEWVRAYRRSVGDRIRQRRERANRTQNRLAEVCGVDRTTYQRWEYGLSDPSLGELAIIADEVGVSVADLVGVEVLRPS